MLSACWSVLFSCIVATVLTFAVVNLLVFVVLSRSLCRNCPHGRYFQPAAVAIVFSEALCHPHRYPHGRCFQPASLVLFLLPALSTAPSLFFACRLSLMLFFLPPRLIVIVLSQHVTSDNTCYQYLCRCCSNSTGVGVFHLSLPTVVVLNVGACVE